MDGCPTRRWANIRCFVRRSDARDRSGDRVSATEGCEIRYRRSRLEKGKRNTAFPTSTKGEPWGLRRPQKSTSLLLVVGSNDRTVQGKITFLTRHHPTPKADSSPCLPTNSRCRVQRLRRSLLGWVRYGSKPTRPTTRCSGHATSGAPPNGNVGRR